MTKTIPNTTPEANIEDRAIRSQKARVALRIFLQRCAVRMGVESLVLADGRGQSVVCTDETTDAMQAARHAAGLYHDGELVPDSLDRKQQVWPVSLGVDVGFLLALGEPELSAEDVSETCDGIARILSRHL